MEAQSTWTYNILIRFLIYIADTYNQYIEKNGLNVYGSKKLNLPVPELYVIYTGSQEDIPDTISLRNDVFGADSSSIDVTARVIRDSNEGDIINQFIAFAKVYDEQIKTHGYTRKAAEEIIRICLEKDTLTEYMREEEIAEKMFDIIDEDKAFQLALKEEREEGHAEAEIATRVIDVDRVMEEFNCSLNKACDVLGITVEAYHDYKERASEISTI